MNIFVLDGKAMLDKESAHQLLKKELNLPEYYGNNLDALADCLKEFDHNNLIVIVNEKQLIENLDEYGKIMIEIFKKRGENDYQLLIYE